MSDGYDRVKHLDRSNVERAQVIQKFFDLPSQDDAVVQALAIADAIVEACEGDINTPLTVKITFPLVGNGRRGVDCKVLYL